ncbi:glycosyltransferase family 39 protein [bacterium]|nr:glycosyltransferase family 39 protein [candidate division CSSED10-310 bacterium]
MKRLKNPYLIGIFVAGAAFLIRIYRLQSMHNYIDDLSARQAIIVLDMINGIWHFPFSPYLFEFDEPGLAFLTLPFVYLFGKSWSVFQYFSVVSGVLATFALFLLTARLVSTYAGTAAALVYGLLPCMLFWNRFYFMSGIDWLTIIWLGVLLLLFKKNGISSISAALAGFLVGLGMYLTSLIHLITPAAAYLILFKSNSDDNHRWKKRIANLFIFSSCIIITSSLILIDLIRQPNYLLWRKTHFISWNTGFFNTILVWLKNITEIIYEMFLHTKNFINIPPGKTLIVWPLALLFLWGIISSFKYRRFRSPGLSSLIVVITWLLLIATLKSEPFRGIYFSLPIPFLAILSGIGLHSLLNILFKKTQRLWWISTLILCTVWSGFCLWSFLYGPFKHPGREDVLTRLQLDLKKLPDIPCLVSTKISDVRYYHFPFWFVMRSYMSSVTVFTWNETGFYISEDVPKTKFAFESAPDQKTAFIVTRNELEALRTMMLPYKSIGIKKLAHSHLFLMTYPVTPTEPARLNWRTSAVPQFLPSSDTP